MKNINTPGIFNDRFLQEKLTKLVDQLEKLNEFISWNIKLLTGQVLSVSLY